MIKPKLFSVQSPDDPAAGGGGTGSGAGGGTGSGAAGGASSGTGSGSGAAAAAGGAPAGAGGAGGVQSPGAGAAAGAGSAAAGSGAAGGAGAASGADSAGASGSGAAAGAPSWDADHWRSTFAGADDKKKAWAERRTDLKVALDSGYAADQKIAELSAVAKTVLPKDATPEQVSQYRKDNGIPEKAEGYFDTLPKEVTSRLDDGSKSIITPYLTAMQELNLTPAQAAKLIAVRQDEATRYAEQRNVLDGQQRQKTEDVLRQDWGNNYRAEVNNINNMLAGAPEQVRNAIMAARTPEGSTLLSSPETMRWLAQLARTVSPYGTIVGGDGGSLDQKGVDSRITEIESWMGAQKGSADFKKYYDNPDVQKQYRDLIDSRELMKKRSA